MIQRLLLRGRGRSVQSRTFQAPINLLGLCSPVYVGHSRASLAKYISCSLSVVRKRFSGFSAGLGRRMSSNKWTYNGRKTKNVLKS